MFRTFQNKMHCNRDAVLDIGRVKNACGLYKFSVSYNRPGTFRVVVKQKRVLFSSMKVGGKRGGKKEREGREGGKDARFLFLIISPPKSKLIGITHTRVVG